MAADASGELGAAVALYLDLLIGDLQIRRVIGRADAPTPEMAEARSRRALAILPSALNVIAKDGAK